MKILQHTPFRALSLWTCILLPCALGAAPPAGSPGGGGRQGFSHANHFTDNTYAGTASCLGSNCHSKEAHDVLTTGHWNWQGVAANVVGAEGEVHGKNDFINNFCIAVPTNEGRCAQCHIGYGYTDPTFDFGDPAKIDCLICHDQTGTYKKALTNGGLPDSTVDLQAVARSVGDNDGVPGRKNCIVCHANAGGGDNVKHGDLAMNLLDTTREYDVHMAADGADMTCVACHDVDRTPGGKVASHGIGGMPFHSVDEGTMKQCVDCHAGASNIHKGDVANMVSNHARLACQVCHIPAIARHTSTKVEWYWAEAGDLDRVPVLDEDGRPDYDKMKGEFVWASDLRPTLRFHNGKWHKTMIATNDVLSGEPVDLASPAATRDDADAMIYPFKKMIGNQVADAAYDTLLVPHLFKATDLMPTPYWGVYDWDLALWDAQSYWGFFDFLAGQPYSGTNKFVATEMLLAVNHEIAPKEDSLGANADCSDCHGGDQIDWLALGWEEDPYQTPGEVLDLDIKSFKVTKKVSLTKGQGVISLELTVENGGLTEGSADATITGVQDDAQVYVQTVSVTDGVGNGSTKYTLQSYFPDATGDIQWTVEIADGYPDDDVAAATTTVNP